MFIADLSTEGYFVRGEAIRAVGWLEGDHPYSRGSVPAPFLQRLKEQVESQRVEPTFRIIMFLGWHDCSLCPPGDRMRESRNLLIPTPEVLYAAPAMIVHYIEDHDYRPPQEFIDAVMACPPQKSPEFMALLDPRPPIPPRFGAAPSGVTCRARRAAYAIVRDDRGRVAVIRMEGPGENRYWLPGGGIEPDETAEVAVFREVREELGRWIRLRESLGETVQIFYAADDACWLDPKTDTGLFFHASHAWAASANPSSARIRPP
jgi:hypothetical protein